MLLAPTLASIFCPIMHIMSWQKISSMSKQGGGGEIRVKENKKEREGKRKKQQVPQIVII